MLSQKYQLFCPSGILEGDFCYKVTNFFIKVNYHPLDKRITPFNKPKFPSPKDAVCKV